MAPSKEPKKQGRAAAKELTQAEKEARNERWLIAQMAAQIASGYIADGNQVPPPDKIAAFSVKVAESICELMGLLP